MGKTLFRRVFSVKNFKEFTPQGLCLKNIISAFILGLKNMNSARCIVLLYGLSE